MSYNTKNYTEQGGAKTVIGGELEVKEGAIIRGLPSFGFLQVVHQAASVAQDVPSLVADLNVLLEKLKAAGIMAPNEP